MSTRVFELRLAASHPALGHHRVFGKAVLPGLAYVDLLYQLAAAGLGVDHRDVALRKLTIHAPLVLDDGADIELAFCFEPVSAGWDIEIAAVGAAHATPFATAQLRREPIQHAGNIDIPGRVLAASHIVGMDTIYAAARERGLVHTGLMVARGEIHVLGQDRLAHLAATDVDANAQLLFHPALIDGAAMATESLRGADDASLYLPLCYDAFTCSAPLGSACWVQIRGDSVRSANDIHTLDITFYDADGRQIAALEGITSKRVRSADHITQARVPAALTAAPCAAPADAGAVGDVLRTIIAAHLDIAPSAVNPVAGFFTLGLQSSQLLAVVNDIERSFGLTLSPTLLFEYGTLEEVGAYVSTELAQRAPVPGAALPHPAASDVDYEFAATDPLLADHRVYGRPALMGIVHPCLAAHSALSNGVAGLPLVLERVVFHGGPIMLARDERVRLGVSWSVDHDTSEFRVARRLDDVVHCVGRVSRDGSCAAENVDLDALWSNAVALTQDDVQRIYRGVRDFELGTTLRTIDRAARTQSTLITRVRLDGVRQRAPDGGAYPLDPLLLAACFFLDAAVEPALADAAALVPLAIERMTLFRAATPSVVVVNTVRVRREGYVAFDAAVYTEGGECIVQIRNAALRTLPEAHFAPAFESAAAHSQRSGGAMPIAVIGLSGRYPQAPDLGAFWRNLAEGRDCITEIPAERWDWRDYYSSDARAPARIASKWGGFIDGVDLFAPLFFSIAPRDAALMDPQERLFLEESWNALEDAGYTRAGIGAGQAGAGQVGVYVGVMSQEYALYAVDPNAGAGRVGIPSGVGSIANRVSYCFDFRGPSMTIDTMCSGSLTAIALACDALRDGRIDAALAGGVNVSVHPNKYLMLGQGGFLSAQGQCGSFGSGSGGYVPGEGVGVAVLKRLDDALRGGDHIYGAIRGIAINHGGHTSGYSVPNPQAQHDVIRRAWQQSGVDPRRITYVEAHGTGTLLGDPIEIEGLTRAFREHTPARGFCAIGSVKSNVGHCESAAGIAALTKVLLQLRHGELVPSLHCDVLNPNIDFARSPFVVQRHSAPWPRLALEQGGRTVEHPRAAGISSFGAGGSNTHVVVEEVINTRVEPPATGPALIVLSAKSAAELDAVAARLLQALQSCSYAEGDLARIAYTLQTGREAMGERLAIVADSIDMLRESLARCIDGAPPAGCVRARAGSDAAFSTFAHDDDLGTTVSAWFAQGKLGKVAQWWAHGATLDWSRLYPQRQPRRIGLPTYPFARQRCWIGVDAPVIAATVGSEISTPVVVAPHVFSETWVPSDLEPASTEAGAEPVCLVFVSKTHQRATMAAAIAQTWPHARVVFVAESRCAEVDAEQSPIVSCSDPAHFKTTFAAMRARWSRFDFVFHLWALDDPAFVVDAAALMLSLQALAGSGISVGRFVAAGRHAAGALAECYLEVQDALVRSARLLLPAAQLATVFEEVDATASDDARWAQRLTAAVRAARLESSRRRGAQRLTREYRPVPIPFELPAALPYKAGGTYLITGGLGGLGLIVARHFARTLRGRLVLVGRAALDERRRAAIAELEALGASVTYLACDVADAAALRVALDAVRSGIGAIHGVVHAAGVAGSAAPSEKTPIEFNAVMAPKVAGTLALDEVLDGDPLDFVCYFSSVAAVLGDFGAGDYAGANRFQFTYARQRNRSARRGRTVAISWPLWRDSGLEFGSRESQAMYLKTSGQKALEADAALRLMPHLIGLDLIGRTDASPIVLVGERERLAAMLAGERAPLRAASSAAPPSLPGGMSLVRRVEHDLKMLVGALLHIAIEQVQRSANLADFGFDSVSLQELALRLGERYGFDVAPALFFDYPTIERLAGHLIASHRDAVAAVFEATPIATVPVAGAAREAAPLPLRATAPEPIALIGMSGRFPKARSIEEMWELLASGADAIEEIPLQRFDWRPYYTPGNVAVAGATNCKWSGIVPGAGEFDPLFFEISPREAAQIDPRQRLLLQESYLALEDAGYGPAQLAAGRVGVFVGAESGAYGGANAEKETITANHEAVLAARLSYFLDLSGPNMAINTACSSGLVALHEACLHLRARECDTAIVAAVNLMLAPESFVGMSQTGMLSPDGRCFAFDRRANGMVPGEAVVALVIKRLTDAQADGDPIHALIRGSGVNHDGRTNGLTAPSGRAQQRLLAGIYDAHDIDPGNIDYVIAHGTATNLGDQIEIRALCAAFAPRSARGRHCALTSTKSNFGHTFAASGLVSVVAMVAAMRQAVIPRSLHCIDESDFVRWEDSPFFVNKSNRPWPAAAGKARLGAISAFGMSGTNAHVVVESHEAAEPLLERPLYLLALSGRNDDALRRRAAELSTWLGTASAVDLAGVSHTLLAGRRHHRHRLALVVDTAQAAIDALNAFAPDAVQHGVRYGVVERDFVAEPDAQAQVARLVRQCAATTDAARLHDALLGLASAYCAGHEADWRSLWQADAPRRVHVPGYPFERQHYWQERSGAAPQVAPAPARMIEPAIASTSLTDHVVALVIEHLGVARADIGDDDALDEFGLDSIGAAKLVAQIRELLPDAVNSLFLECNTISGVRAYIDGFHDRAAAFALAQAECAAPAVAAPAASTANGVGIIGLAGLFPGAATVTAFWDNLRAGTVVTCPLPARRRELLGLAFDAPPCHGGYVDAIECFDHERFKMTRDEARNADPQLRKLLEVVWQAVADAGYAVAEFKRVPTGVFVATTGHSGYREIPDYREPGIGLGAAETPGLYASRLSNLFDFKGPSAVIDAGCASFLVALENAISAIETGRCDQAVVATAQLYLSPHALATADHGALYSKGTSTRSFSRYSDGYVRSEAVGALIVKRIADAGRDGDDLYCRVLGAGVCHGGKSPLKWYSPNIKGQRAAIRAALDRAGVAGSSIGYVEADANGSQLGDASEIVAVQSEYRRTQEEATGTTCIGSLKPLCGHAEVASTFPALVKVVMSLRHRVLLGVVDPGELNEGIALKPGFEILTETRAWHADAVPRRGAVHSLSIGGVNAHVVLEEFRAPAASAARAAHIFVYSARTPELLHATVTAQLAFLERCGDDAPLPGDVAHTLQTGRDAESLRLAVVAATLAELATHLVQWLKTGASGTGVLGDDAPADTRAHAQRWVSGAAVDWRALHDIPRRRTHLPAASLQRESHWHHEVGASTPSARVEHHVEAGVGAVLLQPKWTAQKIPAAGPVETFAMPRRTVLFCGWPRARLEEFRRQRDRDDVREIELAPASPAELFRVCSKAVFGVVREILGELRSERVLLQLVIPSGLEHVGLHGLVGLIRTAAQEHSRFAGQLIVVDRQMGAAECIAAVRRMATDRHTDYVQLRDNTRWKQSWEVVSAERTQAQPLASGMPVVLVTGGAGGIGLDLAERILQRNGQATVVLAGRSPNPRSSERIARLHVRGGRLHYVQADVGSAREVDALVAEVLCRYGRLNGVFHCAAVTRDSFIVRKEVDDIDAVLVPKVAGLHHLDEATKDVPLDFLVAFSSLSSVFGNPGQADYSMANSFMDAFAAYRNQLVCLGERSGRTLSINWPLWSGGGMTMSDELRQHLRDEHGWMPMPNSVGVDIALDLLNGSATQIAVKYGHMARLLDDNVHAECV